MRVEKRVAAAEKECADERARCAGLEGELERMTSVYAKLSNSRYEVNSALLVGPSKSLGLGSAGRISYFEAQGENFVLHGRYSERRSYNNRSKTLSTPGIVRKTYDDGLPFVRTDLPVATTPQYKQEQKKLGLKGPDVDKLTLKARSYAAFPVEEPGPVPRRIGVILVECEKPAAFTEDAARTALHPALVSTWLLKGALEFTAAEGEN